MRPLDKVIQVLLDVLDDGGLNDFQLKHTLKLVQEECAFVPPEAIAFQWNRVAGACTSALFYSPFPQEKIETRNLLIDILLDKKDYREYLKPIAQP